MRIAILGAGIGGLTTALALKKQGLEVQIFESASEIRAVGAGIWMPPNAMKVFDVLSIGNQVRTVGIELSQIEIKDNQDNCISKIDGKWLKEKFGSGSISIERTQLHKILASSLSTANLSLGFVCENVEQRMNQIRLNFTNGKSESFDYLIASDGIKSVVRQSLFVSRPLRYSGQTCYRGIVTIENFTYLKSGAIEYWGDGTRFGISTVGENKFYWYSTISQPPGIHLEQKHIRPFLEKTFKDFPLSVRKIINSLNNAEIIQTDLFDLTPGSDWVKDNVVLLGDAAHATTPNLGQGAAMAIEDAYVLAEEIAKTNDLSNAFAQYKLKRQERVRFIVDTSFKIGQMANSNNKLANKIRNFVMRNTPRIIIERQLNKIYNSDLF